MRQREGKGEERGRLFTLSFVSFRSPSHRRNPSQPWPHQIKNPPPPPPPKQTVSALLQIINPLMWLSPSLVARSHSKFFNAVFASTVGGGGRGGGPSSSGSSSVATSTSTPLSADQRARLDAVVAADAAKAQAAAASRAARARDPLGSLPSRSSSTREILSWLRWAFLEPENTARFPWYLRWLKRTLIAPLYLAFPLGPRLLSIRDTRDVAVDALRPWLKSKGLRVSKGDACFFSTCRAWECRSFGAVAAVLGCVPLVSWLLAFATTAGAALWAADLERFGGGSRVLVPPQAVPAPPSAPSATGGGGGPLQQQAEKQQAASAAAAVSASKQEL